MTDPYLRHLVPAPEFRALVDTVPYRPSQFDADGLTDRKLDFQGSGQEGFIKAMVTALNRTLVKR